MTDTATKYRPGKPTAAQWTERLWYLYSQKLGIINLLGERDQERTLLEIMAILMKQIGDHRTSIDFSLMRVRYLCDVGDLSQAESNISRLFEQISPDDDKSTLMKALEWRALIFRERTNLGQALQDYAAAEKLADSEMALAGIWLDKGLTLSYANKLAEAEELLKKTIAVYEKYNSVDILGDANNNLGICMIKQARVGEALKAYTSALKCYDKIGYKLGSAIVSGNIAEIHWHLGDFDQGHLTASRCVALGLETEDPISICLGYEMLGRLNMDVGNYRQAVKMFERSIEAIKQVNDLVIEAQEHGYLAVCLSREGRCDEAEDRFNMAESIAGQASDDAVKGLLGYFKILMYACMKSPAEIVKLIDVYLAAPENKFFQNNCYALLLKKTVALISLEKLRDAQKCFADLLNYKNVQVYKPILFKTHSVGHQLYDKLGDAVLAAGHRQKAQIILNEILAKMSDPTTRSYFTEQEEIKALLK